MAWDKKDRALLAASSLVGYCLSAASLRGQMESEEQAKTMNDWVKRLLEYAEKAAVAINAAHCDESTDEGGAAR